MSATAAPGSALHATAVVFGENGVVIVGPSGAGKSALALALMAQARTTGRFGALVGDDRIWLRAVGGRLIASGAPHTAGLIERRGAGVEPAPSEPVAVVRLVIDLSGPDRGWPRWPDEPDVVILEGVSVPRLGLSSAAGAVDNAFSVIDRVKLLVAEGRDATNFA